MILKNTTILALLFSIILSCKKKDDPIPDPTLSLSSSEISLGSVDINTKYSLVLLKNGTGDISYTVSSDGNWYAVNKNSGSLSTSSADTLKLAMVSASLKKGENIGVITITPTINNKPGTTIKVNVKGSYNAPTVVPNTMEIDLGAIDAEMKYNLVLTKSGIGTVSYNIVGEVNSWITANKAVSDLNTAKTDTIKLVIFRSKLKKGPIETFVTIEPTSNGVRIEDIKIKIKGTYTAPTITPSVTAIDLGKVTDQTKASFTITPKGVGTILYDIKSSKTWLSVDKPSFGFTSNTANTVNLVINQKDMDNGDNEAVLTITPTINDVKEAPIQIKVTGNYAKVITTGTYKLTKNETWSGTVFLNGKVEVPKGITLTVLPGTIINAVPASNKAGLTISFEGKLVLNGTADKLITLKSSGEFPRDYDWTGIYVFGEVQAQYCVFANSGGLYVSPIGNSSKTANINNCLFYNNLSGAKFSSDLILNLKNCSFILSGGIEFAGDYGGFDILNCDFQSNDDDDISLFGASYKKGKISKCNFPISKKYDFYENLEVYEDKNYVSNEVKADNCYYLKSISPLKYGNTFEQTNPSSTKIAGTGCGFEFSQTLINKSSKAEREADKAKINAEFNKAKAKYLAK